MSIAFYKHGEFGLVFVNRIDNATFIDSSEKGIYVQTKLEKPTEYLKGKDFDVFNIRS